MEIEEHLQPIVTALREGSVVPCLGPGALADVVDRVSGAPMPADGDDLILALNRGRPLAPRLMYEFSRAAMNIELKRGRGAVTRFLDQLYAHGRWTRAALHEALADLGLGYLIDLNRDTQLLELYGDRPHLLIQGLARIGGTDHRFRLYRFDGSGYRPLPPDASPPAGLPLLFKPVGCPLPESHYVASDADYVDYLTELMGGFGVPRFLKTRRRGLRYLLLGLRLTRDTERMILSDLIHEAAAPAGWALITEPTPKERRFCARHRIEIVPLGLSELLATLTAVTTP